MIKHYFIVALRNLLKYKTQTIISIIGLAVGLFSFSLCFYCSRFVESLNTDFTHCERLAEIHLCQDGHRKASVQANLPEELRKLALPEVEAIACITYPAERDYNVEVGDDKVLPYTFTVLETDSLYDRLFTPRVLSGSWKVAARTPNSIILSESTARKVFGTAPAIGKRMTLNRRLYTSPESTPKEGGIAYTVQAVVSDLPVNTSMNFMMTIDLLTLNDSEGLLHCNWRDTMTGAYAYALLRPDKSCADLQQTLKERLFTFSNREKEISEVVVAPIGQFFKRESMAHYLSLITGIIGVLILLSGLLNFFHFEIGTFFNRTRECSVRRVTGGGVEQLFALLLTQLVLVLIVALLLMLWAVELLSPYLHLSLFQLNLVIEPQLLLQHLAEYFGFLLLLCALLCWMTAVRLHRIKVQTGLRGGERKRGKHRMRNVMLGTQFFICWIFVSFTVALFLQAETTTNALFGTLTQREKAAIFSIPLDYTFWKHEQKLQMVNRIRTHAGVKEVLLSDVNYMQGVSGTGILTEKDNRDSYLEVNVMAVPANFFTFMHLPVVKGKPMANQNEMLVDEVFARKQKEAVMGRMLYNFSEGYTVCGVAETFIADVYNESPGFVFLPTHSEDYVGHCYVKAVAGQEHEVKAWIEKVQRQCLPESVTPRVSTLLNDIHEEQAVEYKMKSIILFFSIVSVIITLLGVYSAITLDTERRQKEVAIRKVNGAGVWRIIVLFARLYGWLLIVTAALSFPLVGVVLRLWKQGYTVFFQTGIGFYAGIFAAVTLVTAFTIFLRIVRTARMNPAESIKNE